MASFEHQDYAPLTGTIFTMLTVDSADGVFTFEGAPEGAESLLLTEIRPLPVCDYPGRVREIPFILSFRAKCALPQGQYRLRHETLGDLELFLVPNGPKPDGFAMSAGFS